jgi:hypothetical protein
MSNDQSGETKWRYFRGGEADRIYRCPANGRKIEKQAISDVHLLWRDGSWREGHRHAVIREMLKGWFAEQTDEISETEMVELVERWRVEGWPKGY